MQRFVLNVFLAAATLGAASQADPNAPAWSRIAEFATARMREANTPGMALAVTSRERLLHVATFGFSNLHARRPLSADTLFEIGSISKSFTSIALLQLRAEGRFDPEAPITKYLPWFKVKSSFAPITGHHHSAGKGRGDEGCTVRRQVTDPSSSCTR